MTMVCWIHYYLFSGLYSSPLIFTRLVSDKSSGGPNWSGTCRSWGRKHTQFPKPFCSEYQTMNEVQKPSKVNMVGTVAWVVALHSLEKGWQFGGRTYCLHLQGWIVSQARNQQKLATRWPTLQHWSWRQHVPSKCQALYELQSIKT